MSIEFPERLLAFGPCASTAAAAVVALALSGFGQRTPSTPPPQPSVSAVDTASNPLDAPLGLEIALRAAPSLWHERNMPSFTDCLDDIDAEGTFDERLWGSGTWDGRVSPARDRPCLQLLSLFELTYENAPPSVHKLRTAACAASYPQGCEDRVFGDVPLCPDCGEDDVQDHPQYRGLFGMPSPSDAAPLRNIVHDGALDDLREVIDLYSERDIHPERWYPRARDGRMLRLDGLPKQYHSNIDIVAPLDRRPGSAPTLTRFEIDDVIAFPITLTDAYTIAR